MSQWSLLVLADEAICRRRMGYAAGPPTPYLHPELNDVAEVCSRNDLLDCINRMQLSCVMKSPR